MPGPRSGRHWPGRPRSATGKHRRCDVRAGLPPERLILRNSRQWICSRATGRALEVAVGTGLNLRHYPDDVALTALDLDQELLSIARERAEVSRQVSLVRADAAHLPFPTGSFDTVVCTLAMCEFRDRGAVLAEMNRVLRPQGRLLLLDHAQWRWILHGRPATLLFDAGFVPYRQERLWFGLIQRLEARRPT
ncbi:class I SAM-dependent methyltransferase [Promicromonospora panici]|uniref:class I SAM-dependent methyltransferase n=1 Tax=Promicromonospora panici TaxID=2219658 RepID=UPI00101C0045|nr:class I SAM-dependent methyltransferase [Promicromonospora panici]